MADFTSALNVGKDILPFAGPIFSLLSGLFGKSPEDQYKEAQQENLRRQIDAIRTNSSLQRARTERAYRQSSALARQAGARQKAALGYAGSESVFTSPAESNLADTQQENLSRINEAETGAIANANAGQQTLPSYAFPHASNYISSALSGVNQLLTQQDLFGLERERLRRMPMLGSDGGSSLGGSGWGIGTDWTNP